MLIKEELLQVIASVRTDPALDREAVVDAFTRALLGKQETAALDAITAAGEMNTQQIATILGVTLQGANVVLSHLEDYGLIDHRRESYWLFWKLKERM